MFIITMLSMPASFQLPLYSYFRNGYTLLMPVDGRYCYQLLVVRELEPLTLEMISYITKSMHLSKSFNSSVPLTSMATASTNICERMDRYWELSELQPGTIIGCDLWNKSSLEISLNH